MAGIAGVQGDNINALETLLTSLRHRASPGTWATSTKHTKIGCGKLESKSPLQHQLNSTGLQRPERLIASHTVEFRAPFWTQKVADFCRKLPAEWKVHGPDREEKWIMSEAFSARLPRHLLFRRKHSFGSGAGSTTFSGITIEKEISDEEFIENRCTKNSFDFHYSEGPLYHRVFKGKSRYPSLPRLIALWDLFEPGFRI